MRLYFHLIYSFFKIGLLGFGGGYAMLSLIQSEVVTKYGWISSHQFADIIAISQLTPGPIGINMATYVGYVSATNANASILTGILGSFLATISLVIPSFAMMFFATTYIKKHKDSVTQKIVFKALRPVIVGLLGSAAVLLMNKENFNSWSEDPWQFCVSIFLFIFSFIGTYHFHYNAIFILVLAGFTGWLLF